MKRVPVHESPERLLPEISEEHENDLNDGAMGDDVQLNVQQHEVNDDDAIEQNQGEEHVVIGVQHDENDNGHANVQHDENDVNHANIQHDENDVNHANIQHDENDDGHANVQHDENDVNHANLQHDEYDINHANVRHEGNDDDHHLNGAQQQPEGIDEGSFSNFLMCHFDWGIKIN